MMRCNQIILFAASISFLGCATVGPQFFDSAVNDRNRAPASMAIPQRYDQEDVPKVDAVQNQIEADYLFLKSDLESQAGKPAESIETLKSALVYDPNSSTLMQKMAVEYYKRGQTRDALYWAEKARTQNPEREEIGLLIAGLHTATRNYAKAEQEYLTLLKKDKDNVEVLLYLGAVYSEMKNYKKSIQLFKQLAVKPQYTSKHLAYYYLARVYVEQGLKNSSQLAKESLQKSLKAKPTFFEATSLMGHLLEKEGGQEKAIKFYSEQQKKFGPMPKVAEVLAQYYIEKNKYDLAYDQLEIMDASAEDQIQIKLKMALILIDRKDYDTAAEKLKEILQLAPESDKVRFYLAAVYEEKKQLKTAFDEYLKIEKTSSYFEEARLHAAYLGKLMGENDLAMKVLKECVAEKKIENPQTLFLMAQFHEDRKDLNKALETLNFAENQFPKNAQVIFYKGTLQDKMNLKDQMISTMKKVLEVEPDHVQAMNYLAFSWAEMNKELDQAEKYARMAAAREKNDAFILDTLGWVLFKKGRYGEASESLEKAHAMQPSVGIIAEHLGDVYSKIEKYEKARALFLKAIENETDSEKKKDIEQKISLVENGIKGRRPASIAPDAEKAVAP